LIRPHPFANVSDLNLGLVFKLFFVWIFLLFLFSLRKKKITACKKHHCHHHGVVIEAKLSEEQEEPQRIDWVPDEIRLPTPRREQREQQFHEHCLMMDALRHSIHSLAFLQILRKHNMRRNRT
jgi:hypothetical protein